MILLAWESDRRVLARSAANNSMNSGWAWFVLEEQPSVGWLYLQPLLSSEGMDAFAEQVRDYSKTRFNLTFTADSVVTADSVDRAHSSALHNAILLYAHAATKMMSEGGNLRDGQAVTKALRSTTFEGVGKLVALDSNGDSVESYEFLNYVLEANGVIGSVPVGLYSRTLQQYRAYERAVVWPGNSTVVPVDLFVAEPVCSTGKQGKNTNGERDDGGRYFDERSQSCQLCPVGFYAPKSLSNIPECLSCQNEAGYGDEEGRTRACV